MKVKVDFDLCESNAICMQVLPSVFEVRDDDYLYILREELEPSEEELAGEAVRRCPRQAITLEP